jgi:hypothetical protein
MPETKVNGHLRIIVVMLDAGEAFFFGRGDEFPITKESCC